MRFRHRGLRRFYERGDEGAISQNQQQRIRLLLTALEHANRPGDLGQPGFRLHPLRRSDEWSVRVSGNWRLTFRFVDGEAVDVDLVDYHWAQASVLDILRSADA